MRNRTAGGFEGVGLQATVRTEGDLNGRVELKTRDLEHDSCKDTQSPTMEATNVESQEPLLRDQTQTSSKLKQEASPTQTPFLTGSERTYRDSTFTFLFLTAILTTFTFGIIASTRTDTLNMDTKLRLSHFNPTTNTCEITHQQSPKDSDSYLDSGFAFVTLAAIASLSALALTIPLSLLLVSLLRRYTRPLLLLSAPFMSLFFLGIGLLWFLGMGLLCLRNSEVCRTRVSSNIPAALYLLGMSALQAYSFWKSWTGSAVENAVEVLSMATGFWKEHFVLLFVNPLLLMGAMVVVNGPIFTFMWYAFNVGVIVPDFDVVNDPLKGCELATGIPCCRAERPGWVYAYITFASFTAFWVLTVSMVLQHLVVSGTVSLWYFAPSGTSAIGNIKRSLRNAYGPSFGTACNLGTIVTTLAVGLVGRLKKISDRVLKSNHQGKMPSILHKGLSRLSQFPECYPRLTSTFASISGLSFWESSKESHYLFPQNSPISTARINFHELILHALMGLDFMCTLLQTLVVYGVLEYFSNAYFVTKFLISLLCFPIILIGLGTGFSGAISSVITTVSVCCAMERNVGEVSKPEVCHVFMITATSLPEDEAKLQSA